MSQPFRRRCIQTDLLLPLVGLKKRRRRVLCVRLRQRISVHDDGLLVVRHMRRRREDKVLDDEWHGWRYVMRCDLSMSEARC